MLFTWDTTDLCIVSRNWHISGTGSLIFSLLAIVLLTAAYEAIREMSRRYDSYAQKLAEGRRSGDDLTSKSTSPIYQTSGGYGKRMLGFIPYSQYEDQTLSADEDGTNDESSSLLNPGRMAGRPSEQQTKIVKAVLYAVQVFYSFFIM